MEKVKQYCEYHHQFPSAPSDDKKDERRTDDIIPWDKDFCAALDQPTLFELILVR
jgi:S-phase kinase-associated protein 1